MKFTYRSGQRPLDGYTLKRGIGQGGFGEVYFAVSDAGKEVALKLLHRHPDSELRGIAHCINLKHPNLVHLFDLRTDDRGDYWVVMEYVFGESLAQWINRYPTGLPANLAAEWFAALCRAVAYLHDQGIVHRDLKPANIFVENGHLKVGDYGLSRRISASEGGELTQGIGTPHYMAPEIKSGNYTRSIDIYAMGVILYEMLTGHPPFEGTTAAEVMMKHLTDPPNLSRVPADFRPVLEKALDKNPATRFATVKDFARAVEAIIGTNAPANPIPIAEALPAEPRNAPPTVAVPGQRVVPVAVPLNQRPWYTSGPIPATHRGRFTELAGAIAQVPVVAALCTAPWALAGSADPWPLLGRMFLLSTALSWAMLIAGRPLPLANRSTWNRRFQQLLAGMGVGLLAFWLDGWGIPHGGTAADTSRDLVIGTWARINPETFSIAVRYLCYFGLTAGTIRWWRLTSRKRKERFRFLPILTAGLWAAVFLFLWPWEAASAALAVAPVVIAAVCVQVVSRWVPPAEARPVARAVAVARPVRPRHLVCLAVLFGFLACAGLGCGKPSPRAEREGGASTPEARRARVQAESFAISAVKGAAQYDVAHHPELDQRSWLGRVIHPKIEVKTAIPAPPAPKPLPSPSAAKPAPPPMHSSGPVVIRERVASTIPYPTEAEAEERAKRDVQDRIEQKLKELDPPVQYRPSEGSVEDYIRVGSRRVRPPSEAERVEIAKLGYAPDRVYVEYDVEVTADQVRALRTRERLASGLRALGLVTALAFVGFLFLRLDEWSKGYLTSWLALGAAGLVGVGAALVLV